MRTPRNKLTYYRLSNIMSQEDVAQKLGISQAYYGRLERNPTNINVGMAIKLKSIFKVNTLDELFSDAS
ncbi:helix-turn-helix transcriptional regulator [Paenibacillus sp. FSL L8-0494]|uniref:helix-turn-helix transcriptional regulator n=1 Tax=Paenibacillus sp. FSL L8-0494 TaxID=2975352 RepID=UPI0030FAA2A5